MQNSRLGALSFDLSGDMSNDAPFEEFFHRHYPRIIRVIRAITGDAAEAEDLAIESFTKLWKEKIDHDAAPAAGWLYRVALNLSYNALRARKRRVQYESEAAQLIPSTDHATAESKQIQREKQLRVRNTLEKMKERDARILLLRYGGCSYGEIAEATGVSQTSVGTLLLRAEKEFEQRFSGDYK